MAIPKSEQTFGTDLDIEFRRLLTRLIRQCPKSRDQIAEEMSVHSPFPITKDKLNDWTAESKEPNRRGRFPAFLIPVFCKVTGSDEMQRWAMGARLRELLEVGESVIRVQDRKAKKS